VGMLTTKDLLDEAEAQLNNSDNEADTVSERVLWALKSIAASQLVIARASAGIRAK